MLLQPGQVRCPARAVGGATMADKPVHVVTASFNFPDAAKVAIKQLKEDQRAKHFKLGAAAALSVDDEGKLRIIETADLGGGKGSVIGGAARAGLCVAGRRGAWRDRRAGRLGGRRCRRARRRSGGEVARRRAAG